MPILPILSLAPGPLPLTATFNSPTDGPAVLVVSGSAWCATANQLIGVTLQLDGKPLGSSLIFSNLASTHRATVPVYIPVTLSIGAHKIALVPLNSSTTTDQNDYFNVILDY